MGTISYMPPEMLKELPVSEKVDLYSFAIVLWYTQLLPLVTSSDWALLNSSFFVSFSPLSFRELVTKQIPFSGWKPVQIIWFIAGENRRLPLPDDCPEFLRTMIEG